MKMKYKDIISYVNKILSEYTMRLTLRQVYYRLVANYKLPNTRSNYNCLSAQLVRAREDGDVDEDRIEDRTRGFLGGDGGYRSPDRFAESYNLYKMDEEKFKQLTDLSRQIASLQAQYAAVKNAMKKIAW